jgi:hypothetical protein
MEKALIKFPLSWIFYYIFLIKFSVGFFSQLLEKIVFFSGWWQFWWKFWINSRNVKREEAILKSPNPGPFIHSFFVTYWNTKETFLQNLSYKKCIEKYAKIAKGFLMFSWCCFPDFSFQILFFASVWNN